MVKIALIDSGIDVNFFESNIDSGVFIDVNSDGQIIVGKDFADLCGHGSACASVIIKECPDTIFYIVKIFGNELVAKYDSLIYALEYLLNSDVNIISLSLAVEVEENRYGEIISITEELHKQGKEIFWAIKNREKRNPAFVHRSFWSVGIDDSVDNLFVNEKQYYICVNTLPYLHYDAVNDGFKLFGASTSYATAKAAGVMAKYIEIYKNNNLARLKFIEDYKEFKKFKLREYRDKTINYDTPVFCILLNIIKKFFGINDDQIIYEYSLFSSKISCHEDFCYELIKIIEERLNICLAPYCSLSKLDFISIFSLYKAILEKSPQ